MAFFIAVMHHPDGPGWGEHVGAHVAYLQELIAQGKLRASGPVKGQDQRGGALIFTVADRSEAMRLIDEDPFVRAGLISSLSLTEWDPIFGAFQPESSRGGRRAPAPKPATPSSACGPARRGRG